PPRRSLLSRIKVKVRLRESALSAIPVPVSGHVVSAAGSLADQQATIYLRQGIQPSSARSHKVGRPVYRIHVSLLFPRVVLFPPAFWKSHRTPRPFARS